MLGQMLEHCQRHQHRAPPDLGAAEIAEALLAVGEAAVLCGGGDMHEPDRLLRRTAARPGNAVLS
jgi:hypothetical protein